MRILQLCKKFPFPLKDGESIAVTHLSRALNDLGCEVTLLSMNTSKHYCDVSRLPDDYNHYKEIHHVKVNNKVKWWEAFWNIFSEESYHITRFISKDFEEKLIQVLKSETFDVVQLETPVLSAYIPVIRKHSKALVAMRSHNVEHEIWERMAENQKFFPLKWYLRQAANKLKRYELKHLNDYDLLLAITSRDLKILKEMGLKKPSSVIPIGLDVRDYKPDLKSFQAAPSLSFIGSLDWMPNQEGLRWFLENVWSEIKEKHPQITLHVAGRNTPPWVKNLKIDGIKVLGEIADSIKFINQHSIMVVPLFSGSGMRVKILEGMALGKVVISTSLGLEGIDATDNKEVFVANDPISFIEHLSNCIEDQKKMLEIGRQAQELVAEQYDNLQIAKKLAKVYKNHLPAPAEEIAKVEV
ncbi:MAG: glycosyltransferase family 4 protein [Saprospiraceae bacterium]